ncbi:hypothetical protein [Pontibacter akesuensis]|nr:hypothetical protein [Pontibacter akesuensis]GHA59407.1 hypothetical protein GCM10007389_09300 [Pontibacter akesuensis]
MQVSYKYEVDHQYLFLEMDDTLTPTEKLELNRELDKKGEAIIWQSRFVLVVAAASFVTAITLSLRKIKYR